MNRSMLVGPAVFVFCLGSAACTPSPATSPQPSGGELALEPAAAAPSEESSGAPEAGQEMTSVFVVHSVHDFDAYLEQFKSHAATREEVGVKRAIMGRFVDDPNRVIVHFSAISWERVEEFLHSEEYQALVDADTATEFTLLWTSHDVFDALPDSAFGSSTSLFKKFPVGDLDCLSAELEKKLAELSQEGVSVSLHRSSADDGVAILHLVGPDRAKVESVFTGATFETAFSECGAEQYAEPLLSTNQDLSAP